MPQSSGDIGTVIFFSSIPSTTFHLSISYRLPLRILFLNESQLDVLYILTQFSQNDRIYIVSVKVLASSRISQLEKLNFRINGRKLSHFRIVLDFPRNINFPQRLIRFGFYLNSWLFYLPLRYTYISPCFVDLSFSGHLSSYSTTLSRPIYSTVSNRVTPEAKVWISKENNSPFLSIRLFHRVLPRRARQLPLILYKEQTYYLPTG